MAHYIWLYLHFNALYFTFDFIILNIYIYMTKFLQDRKVYDTYLQHKYFYKKNNTKNSN